MPLEKIPDPFPDLNRDDGELIHAVIPAKPHFEYFFRKVLTGDRGPRQKLVRLFISKLYDACIADGIKPQWEPDNEHRIALIVKRLNFNEAKPADSVARPERPVRAGRTNPRAPKSKIKSPVGNGHGRGTQGYDSKAPNLRDIRTDVGSEDSVG